MFFYDFCSPFNRQLQIKNPAPRAGFWAFKAVSGPLAESDQLPPVAPVGADTVALPIKMLPKKTSPLGATATAILTVPTAEGNLKLITKDEPWPLAATPEVGISKEHGLTVIVLPTAKATMAEFVAVKIHEPKVMGPVTVLPVKVSVTVKVEPEKLMVVGPVVPSSATPDAKLTVWPLRACKKAGRCWG